MKKTIFSAIIALASFGTLNAQENIIKANPLAILGGTDLISYERALGDQTSILVSGAIGGFKFSSIQYKTYGGGLQYRYYFNEVFDGWYVTGDAGFQGGTTEIEDLIGLGTSGDEISFTAFNIGARAGYQWLWSSGISFELNLGLGYRSFNYDTDDLSLLKASGILPSGSLAIGYSF